MRWSTRRRAILEPCTHLSTHQDAIRTRIVRLSTHQDVIGARIVRWSTRQDAIRARLGDLSTRKRLIRLPAETCQLAGVRSELGVHGCKLTSGQKVAVSGESGGLREERSPFSGDLGPFLRGRDKLFQWQQIVTGLIAFTAPWTFPLPQLPEANEPAIPATLARP